MGGNREPRRPERTVLYGLVAAHVREYLALSEAPQFIEDTLQGFLGCGKAESGGIWVQCRGCGHEEFVAFSCKYRGVCPSCSARNSTEVSERLVEQVLPRSAYRHWVVNYPPEVNQKLSFRPELVSGMERTVTRTLRRWMEERGVSKTGGVLFRHRFGSNLNLMIHAHLVMLDGGYVEEEGAQKFAQGEPIAQVELEELTEKLFGKMRRYLGRNNVMLSKNGAASPPADEPQSGLAARCGGLHVFVSDPIVDMKKLKNLCVYLMRCGIDGKRLRALPNGEYAYRLSRKDRKGSGELVLSGVDMLKRIGSLIPRKGIPQRRYFGVLASGSKLRAAVIPKVAKREEREIVVSAARRVAWADLMMRVFKIDVLVCKRCNGRMRVIPLRVPESLEQARRELIREPPLIALMGSSARHAA